jgi:hypothetical protein
MADIKIVRLTSGEEIICQFEEKGDIATLKNPAVLIPSPEGKLLLARWLPYADVEDGIDLQTRHFVFVVNAQKQLEDHYTTVVVNNLVVAPKGLVNPLEGSNLKLTL